MNFLRRPSLPNPSSTTTQKKSRTKSEVQYQSVMDLVHDRVLLQIEHSGESIQEILNCASQTAQHWHTAADSSQNLSQCLAKIAHKFGHQSLSEAHVQPSSQTLLKPDDQLQKKEKSRNQMLMASLHQLAKFYALMSSVQRKQAEAVQDELLLAFKQTHELFSENNQKWQLDYVKDCEKISNEIETLKADLKESMKLPQKEAESGSLLEKTHLKIQELETVKKLKIKQCIKNEKFHQIQLVQSIQKMFKVHLNEARWVALQSVEKIADFFDTSSIQDLIQKHPKPSQLFLKRVKSSEQQLSQNEKKSLALTIYKQASFDELTEQKTEFEDPILESVPEPLKKEPASPKLKKLTITQPKFELKIAPRKSSLQEPVPSPLPKQSPDLNRRKSTLPMMEGLFDFSSQHEAEQIVATPPPVYSPIIEESPKSLKGKLLKVNDKKEKENENRKTFDEIQEILKLKNIHPQKSVILYDYQATHDSDLSVQPNDEVDIISVDGEWAYCLLQRQEGVLMGWVPLSYTSLSIRMHELLSL